VEGVVLVRGDGRRHPGPDPRRHDPTTLTPTPTPTPRYVHELQRYEFPFELEIPATYPTTAPDIRIPSLDGKARGERGGRWRAARSLRGARPDTALPALPPPQTAKMYRGGSICLTIHFKPLWAKNAPHFGAAHALCLGLGPWLAAEVPHLVATGVVAPQK